MFYASGAYSGIFSDPAFCDTDLGTGVTPHFQHFMREKQSLGPRSPDDFLAWLHGSCTSMPLIAELVQLSLTWLISMAARRT